MSDARRSGPILLTWGLAAVSLLLLLPVFLMTFTLVGERGGGSIRIYREDVQLNAMRLAMLAAFLVATLHTTSKVSRMAPVFQAHGAVWVLLAAVIAYVQIAAPLPPKTVFTINGARYEVPQIYGPQTYTKVTPVLVVHHCVETHDGFDPWDEDICDLSRSTLREAPERAPFVAGDDALSAVGLIQDGRRLVGLSEAAELIAEEGGLRHYRIARPDHWPQYWISVDAEGDVRRWVACFSTANCNARAMTEWGEMAFETEPDAPQSLSFWDAEEADRLALFAQWRQ